MLSERPEASMEEIAATAGVTRQAVYAHFPSPDALVARLERLISRGQREGDFDPELPAAWLCAAVFGLQHSAVAMIASGAVTAREAEELCLESTLRLCARSGGVRGEMP